MHAAHAARADAHRVHARPGVCTRASGVHELGRYGAPVTQHVRFRLDDDAAAAVDALRARAATAGCSVPPERPALTAAAAVAIPPAARDGARRRVASARSADRLAGHAGQHGGPADELVLAAVVDTELLAVHTAVHDALAGRVRGPVAAYLPGAWLPHCVLASTMPGEAFIALHPVEPVRAQVVGVEVADCPYGRDHPRRLTRSSGRGGRPHRRRRRLGAAAAAEAKIHRWTSLWAWQL